MIQASRTLCQKPAMRTIAEDFFQNTHRQCTAPLTRLFPSHEHQRESSTAALFLLQDGQGKLPTFSCESTRIRLGDKRRGCVLPATVRGGLVEYLAPRPLSKEVSTSHPAQIPATQNLSLSGEEHNHQKELRGDLTQTQPRDDTTQDSALPDRPHVPLIVHPTTPSAQKATHEHRHESTARRQDSIANTSPRKRKKNPLFVTGTTYVRPNRAFKFATKVRKG